jgi:hypothetical protein
MAKAIGVHLPRSGSRVAGEFVVNRMMTMSFSQGPGCATIIEAATVLGGKAQTFAAVPGIKRSDVTS